MDPTPLTVTLNSRGVPMKRCESFGCSNEGVQMYQVAPATNVWLCAKCVEEMRTATGESPETEKLGQVPINYQ